MSRKVCRRKVYESVNPIHVAIRRASLIGDDMLGQLRGVEGKTLEAFMQGSATPYDWRTIAEIVNVAETMADHGIGPEVLEVCQQMEDHLTEAHGRFERTTRLGLTGPGLQCIRDLLEYHDLQRTAVPMGEYLRMVDTTKNRIRSGHPRVKVFV